MKYIIKYVVFIMFQFSLIHAVDFEFEGAVEFTKPYVFVSLGGNCWQAQALRGLRAYGLRDAAFPFDWLFSFNADGLIKCLDERFEHFLDVSYFRRCEARSMDLENFYYDFKFTHDWPYKPDLSRQGFEKQMAFIRQKYTRRINRFNSLASFKGKVFFIRCFQTHSDYVGEWGWNAHYAQKLQNALKRYFPDLNFTLVIVSCTDETVSEIGNLEGIKEYKIRDLTSDNFKAYYKMYNDLIHEILPGSTVTNALSGY